METTTDTTHNCSGTYLGNPDMINSNTKAFLLNMN